MRQMDVALVSQDETSNNKRNEKPNCVLCHCALRNRSPFLDPSVCWWRSLLAFLRRRSRNNEQLPVL